MKHLKIGNIILIVVLLASFYLNFSLYNLIESKNQIITTYQEKVLDTKNEAKELQQVVVDEKVKVALMEVTHVESTRQLKKKIKAIDPQAARNDKVLDIKPNDFIQATQETTLDSLKITTQDTVIMRDSIFIKIQAFKDSNDFYRVRGSVEEGRLNLDRISIPNTITVTTGIKDQTLFKKGVPYATISNSNPYVSITGMQVVAVKPKQYIGWKWVARGLIFGAGIYTGIKLSK